MNDIVAAFHEYFEVIHADTPSCSMKYSAYDIRCYALSSVCQGSTSRAIPTGANAIVMTIIHLMCFFCIARLAVL